MIIKAISFTLITFLCFQPGMAQYEITFEASTDAQTVEVGSVIEIHFTLTNAKGDDLRVPKFSGFEIAGGPNRLFQTKGINGVYTRTANYSYILIASTAGKHIIGSASIKAHGRTFKTNPITVHVVDKGTINKDQEIEGLVQDQYFIRAEINKDSIYPGEQVVLEYKLYSLVGVERFDIQRESTYDGFYMRPMGLYNKRQEKSTVNGIEYTTKSLRKVSLYPQQSGLYTIDPIWMKLAISDPNSSGSRRGFFFLSKVNYKDVTSNAVDLTVLPLPAGPAQNFSSSFGNFSGTSTVDKKTLSTDDVINLKIRITGNGDPKRLNPPVVDLGSEFEVYDPKLMEEHLREYLGETYVRKQWDYIILPRSKGNYTFIPEFIFYNPDSNQYFNALSDTFELSITQGHVVSENPLSFTDNNSSNNSIQPNMTTLTISKGQLGLVGRWWYWGLYLIPLFSFFFLSYKEKEKIKLQNIDPATRRRNAAKILARGQLEEARNALQNNDHKIFYQSVSAALKGYMSDKLNLSAIDMNKDMLRQKLKKHQFEEVDIDAFMQIIKTCDLALYSPGNALEKMNVVYAASEDLIVKLEEKI